MKYFLYVLLAWVALIVLSQRQRYRQNSSSRRVNITRQRMRDGNGNKSLGAIMMLLSNWKISRGRTCYFNASMDALTAHWRPNNKYPIILMNTVPWKYADMSAIRRKWDTLDFKFINVQKVFDYNPTVPLSQLQDVNAQLSDLAYKRMCHFYFQGFTEVPVLMQYKYLMRMDDDTCIQDNINFDVFQNMEDRNAAYAHSSIWMDGPHVTEGLYPFAENYLKEHNLTWTNPELRKRVYSYSSAPAYNTNLEIINTVRYTLPAVSAFINYVVESNMIFHRRWGDAPLRFVLSLMFWKEVEVVALDSFDHQHSTWKAEKMTETPLDPTTHMP